MAESDPLGSTMEMGKIVGKLVSDSSVQTTTGRLEQKKRRRKMEKYGYPTVRSKQRPGDWKLCKKKVNDFPSLMTSDVS